MQPFFGSLSMSYLLLCPSDLTMTQLYVPLTICWLVVVINTIIHTPRDAQECYKGGCRGWYRKEESRLEFDLEFSRSIKFHMLPQFSNSFPFECCSATTKMSMQLKTCD